MFDWANESITHIEWLAFLGNLGIALVCAVLLSFCIRKCSRMIGDKSQYAIIFPMLIPTMVLIITVIKSSLALSLGLVGALSIVRFRTPIKDPEELIYLFVAIAVGLGIGAGQTFITLVAFIFLLLILIGVGIVQRKGDLRGVFLDLDVHLSGKEKASLEDYTAILQQLRVEYQIRRCEKSRDHLSATFYLESKNLPFLETCLDQLRALHEHSQVTLIANHQFPA